MRARIERLGDGLIVRFPPEMVEELGLSEGQVVEIDPRAPKVEKRASDGRLIVGGIPVYSMNELVAEAKRLGPEYEPETVDWGPDRGSEIIDDDDPR